MTPNLSDFGAGAPPEDAADRAHESRTDRARHRRRTYKHGRCRGVSKSKGCRCGGPVYGFSDQKLCHYHANAMDPVTIDDAPGLLARWCGLRATRWDEIPEVVREALSAVDDGAAEVA